MIRRSGTLTAVFMVAASVAGGAPARAQQFETWKNADPTRGPVMACNALRSLSGYEFSIDTASSVPAQEGGVPYCRVVGLVQPEVRFEVSLPEGWNGRLYMFGNGGFAGESLTAPNRAGRRSAALAKGFAVAQTNTGHDAAREPLASFAGDPQKFADYAYRAVHVTAVTAKTLARAYYGAQAARAYFDGCSSGGRQGLIAAQRFPDDFDGIVVGAPVLDFTGTMTHYTAIHKALSNAPLSEEKVRVLADAVYGKCDANDGLSDGLLADPRTCAFDPGVDLPRCTATPTGKTCFTDADVASVKAIYGPVSRGKDARFPGFPVGSEVFTSSPDGPRTGWDPWLLRTGQPTISRLFMESFFKHMATPGAEVDWRTFDAERDTSKLAATAEVLNATDPDLSRFRARNGRILMYYGWADPALNPLMGVEYYERVTRTVGAGTTDFFRLFMMPGVFHCSGGIGPDRVDTITPLAAWVEKGVAPERLVAEQRAAGKATRTRPLCPYPLEARYGGTGSVDAAESFTCAEPRPRP
jgi:feruloyl esterase